MKSTQYHQLPKEEESGYETRPSQGWRKLTHYLISCSLTLWTLVLVYYSAQVYVFQAQNQDSAGSEAWSPLRDAISYHTVQFHSGFDVDNTKYMGNTTEAHKEWEALVRHGIVLLSTSSASRLPFHTARWNEGHGHYVAGIALWHELHCLNWLRKSAFHVHPYNNSAGSEHMQHIDHCVDFLRQMIMCHGDVGIIPYVDLKEKEEGNEAEYKAVFNGTRVCRNYGVLERWVDENQAGDNTPEGSKSGMPGAGHHQ